MYLRGRIRSLKRLPLRADPPSPVTVAASPPSKVSAAKPTLNRTAKSSSNNTCSIGQHVEKRPIHAQKQAAAASLADSIRHRAEGATVENNATSTQDIAASVSPRESNAKCLGVVGRPSTPIGVSYLIYMMWYKLDDDI